MDIDKNIIERQRKIFKGFMEEKKLNAFSWAKKAGITESTIRHYLSGRNRSLTTLVLEKLANAAGASVADLIGENKVIRGAENQVAPAFDRALMLRALADAEEFIVQSGLKIEAKEKANIFMAWYDLAQMLRQDETEGLSPEQSLEVLIRKTGS